MENFVIALLKIAWANQDPPVVAAYRNFLANLVSAQGYYVKPVVRMLVSNFIGFTDRQVILNNGQAASNIDEVIIINQKFFMTFMYFSHRLFKIEMPPNTQVKKNICKSPIKNQIIKNLLL